MSIQTLIEHGPFIAGRPSRWPASTRDRQPGHGRAGRRASPSATAQDADRAVRAAHAAFRGLGAARLRRPRQGHPRVRGGLRGARRRAHADPRRRAGQDDPRGQDRAAQGGRHARALRRPLAPGARDQRPQRRPRRRRRACCAARSAWSPRSCRGTSRRRCCATSSAPRCLTGNTVVAKPADTTPLTTLRLAEIFAEAGPAGGRVQRLPGTGAVVGEALVAPPARAQGRLHRLHADRRARRRARRASAPSA